MEPTPETTQPTELIQLIQGSGLEATKQNAVAQTLDVFFSQASEWSKSIEQIVITSPTETDKMAIAREGRLQLKGLRLNAEKIIDSKRTEVKFRMNNDLLEDKLWLKAGQMIVATFKNLETRLEEKEKFKELYESKERERIKGERLQEIMEYQEFIPTTIDFGVLNQEDYTKVLNSAKAAKKQKQEDELKAIKDKEEADRIIRLTASRESILRPYSQFFDYDNLPDLGTMEDSAFEDYFVSLQTVKSDYDKKQAVIQEENERLIREKAETEARTQRRIKETRGLIVFIRDFNTLIGMDEDSYQKELKDLHIAAEMQLKHDNEKLMEQRKKDEELEAQRKANEILLQEKKDREEKEAKDLQIQKDIEAKEAKEREKADKKAKAAPDRDKLLRLGKFLVELKHEEMNSDEGKAILEDVKTLLTKTSNFIKEKVAAI